VERCPPCSMPPPEQLPHPDARKKRPRKSEAAREAAGAAAAVRGGLAAVALLTMPWSGPICHARLRACRFTCPGPACAANGCRWCCPARFPPLAPHLEWTFDPCCVPACPADSGTEAHAADQAAAVKSLEERSWEEARFRVRVCGTRAVTPRSYWKAW
jgi:hypothetical protein